MLGRTYRFHGQRNLRRVYSQGTSVRGSLISLRYLLRNDTRPYRVAVVVSRQVNKSAVARNRIRRRIYEQIRQADINQGVDLVFTVYADQIKELSSSQLESTINELLHKVSKPES